MPLLTLRWSKYILVVEIQGSFLSSTANSHNFPIPINQSVSPPFVQPTYRQSLTLYHFPLTPHPLLLPASPPSPLTRSRADRQRGRNLSGQPQDNGTVALDSRVQGSGRAG